MRTVLFWLLIFILGCVSGNPAMAQTNTTYQQVAVFKLPSVVAAVAWKPDGSHLAVVAYPSIWLWDVNTQKLSTFIADAKVSGVTWSPDGSKIAAVQGGDDETLLIWDVATGSLVKRMTRASPGMAYIYRPAWSPDGTKIASDGTGNYLLIWTLTGSEHVYPLQGVDGRFGAPHWKADSSQVGAVEGDGAVRIWDNATGKNTLTIPNADLGDWRDNNILGGGSNAAYVWSTVTGQPLLKLDHGASVLAAKWNYDMRLIATGGLDGIVKLWAAQSGALLATCRQEASLISAMAWHPAENLLAIGTYDGTLRIWQIDAQ